MQKTDFEKELKKYLHNTRHADNETAKMFLFLDFIKSAFKGIDADSAPRHFRALGKYVRSRDSTAVVKGYPDFLSGNLIIEFKRKLTEANLREAENQLKEYVWAVWRNGEKRRKYIALASDGVEFRAYRAKHVEEAETSEEVRLEEISRINLGRVGAGDACIWLDRYFNYEKDRAPTSEEFSREFGIKSPVCEQSLGLLREEWEKKVDVKPSIKTFYHEWQRYLRVVYGENVGTSDLFLRHTYMATLAKLVAHSYVEKIPETKEKMLEAVNGKAFDSLGIQNIVEEDFFSWILRTGDDFAQKFSQYLANHIKRFDMGRIEEDVLKGIYQNLVDPTERHDLGEYYTPDWLAELIVTDAVGKQGLRILDPGCGSGSFLMYAVKRKIELGENLNEILSTVMRIDIHPLAVMISRVNYLIALGKLVKERHEKITIPVYLADSINFPKLEAIVEGAAVYKINTGVGIFMVPQRIAENTELLDKILEEVRALVREDIDPRKILEGMKLELKEEEKSILVNLVEMLRELHKEGRDSIWCYILRNAYRPTFFNKVKFDRLVGNPPWLSFRYASPDYQKFLRSAMDGHELLTEKPKLITHMELATLFFVRTSNLFLNMEGIIEFVMPRGIFSSDHHYKYRCGSFKPKIGIDKIVDLKDVKPLFNVPACVVRGREGKSTKYPVTRVGFEGNLERKNSRLEEAEKTLSKKEGKFYLTKFGDRSFLSERKKENFYLRSYYVKKFRQGASIVPKKSWFVDINYPPCSGLNFGFNHNAPPVKSADIKYAKDEYKDVEFSGNVEREFLYATLRGSEIVPFSHLPYKTTVLPAETKRKCFEILDSEEARRRGYRGLATWIKEAEKIWREKKGKNRKMSAVEGLNYMNKLSDQNPDAEYKVLYLTSGKDIAACMLELKEESLEVKVKHDRVQLAGFVADTGTYHYETDDKSEALYLTSFLNSPAVSDLIKEMQSKGLFGPRHIHKKVLELSIPKYNADSELHEKLVGLAEKCIKKSEEELPKLMERYKGIAYIRGGIREVLSRELEQISDITLKILEETSTRGGLGLNAN